MPGNGQLKLKNKNQVGYAGHYKGTLRVIHYTAGQMWYGE